MHFSGHVEKERILKVHLERTGWASQLKRRGLAWVPLKVQQFPHRYRQSALRMGLRSGLYLSEHRRAALLEERDEILAKYNAIGSQKEQKSRRAIF